MTIEALFPDTLALVPVPDPLDTSVPVRIQAWSLIEYQIDLYLEPWTDYDPAGELIRKWRAA